MRCYEFMARTSKVLDVQPRAVQQQQRVGQVVQQIAASDQHQAPTEEDKVLAMMQYRQMKRQRERSYAEQLQQQLAATEGDGTGLKSAGAGWGGVRRK